MQNLSQQLVNLELDSQEFSLAAEEEFTYTPLTQLEATQQRQELEINICKSLQKKDFDENRFDNYFMRQTNY